MQYELYYWPSIQGRGEFIRLALEEAAADYIDVVRTPKRASGGVPAMLELLDGEDIDHPPFAPPILKAGKRVIAQTANILMFLGARHKLAPAGEDGRMWTHQLQLTIEDFLVEVHDVHHPLAKSLYYEDQRKEARRRATDFVPARLPKFLGYMERVLTQNPSGAEHLVGARLSYPDLSLFQIVEGLRYAFPNAMARIEPNYPQVAALHGRVAERPRILAYAASDRRIPFNEDGIFRHYKELDG
ncbi:MAG: glutathione S-transferase family protein [Alphaproteobacteria bacterium]|nr:glutathione S-transferase family protein [Alphaproteobacteria bacterium]